MKEYTLHITEDEAIVLFEFFARFDDTDMLEFSHASEYIALMKVAGQIDKTTAAMFSSDYTTILDGARARIAGGFEGYVPGMKSEP